MVRVMVVTIITVTRKHVDKLKKLDGYVLIYGRRKVGKTFLVRNFLDHDIYFIVKHGGGILGVGTEKEEFDTYEGFLETLKVNLEHGKTVVVDEFQRLPDDFLSYVQTFHPDGRLILTGSSFHVMKDILSPNSPILGLVSEFKLSLISPVNIFRELSEHMEPDKAFEMSPYFRDPWTLQYFQGEETDLEDILFFSKQSIQSLLGEVFLEEERTLSEVYEGIIRALSRGKWKLKEISDLLYGRRLIDRPETSRIRPYFKNMMAMDLVQRIPLHHKRGFKYTIKSPIMKLGYLLDEKYNFFEGDTSERIVKKVVDEHIPRFVESFCGDLFSELYGGTFEYFYSSDFDIDFIITEGSEVLASGEVKWSERVTEKDIERFLDRAEHLQGDKIFFSKNEMEKEGVVCLTPEKLLGRLS